MLRDTRLHKGFRGIRLLPAAKAADEFLLIQEWDAAEDFHAYARFRNEAGGGEKLLAMTTSTSRTSLWLTEPLASAKVEVTLLTGHLAEPRRPYSNRRLSRVA